MAYMVYQQLTTAVKEAYANNPELAELHEQAQACRRFLQSLQIDADLINPIIEPVSYIEEGFRELAVARQKQA